MSYSPKHAAPKTPSTTRRRVTGAAVAGVAVIGGGTALAPSSAYAGSGGVWDRVAACESGGNWSISTGNGYYGGLQFSAQTWLGFGGGKYARYANQATKAQQIAIAQKVLRVQGPGAWPVCSRRAGLTVANGTAVQVGATTARASRTATRTMVANGDLVVDGKRGARTNARLERWSGSGRINGWFSHYDVKNMQRKLDVPVTGRTDARTVRALQRTVGTRVDGQWGPRTTKAVQRYLNRIY